MKRLMMCCALLAAMAVGGWSSTADAHWGRGGVYIGIGRPAFYGGYRGYGFGGIGYAPRYYGGYYTSYSAPRYYGGYYGGGYPVYSYGGGYYGGGYYGGCGW